MTTMRKSLMKKAVQQMTAPAMETEAPMSKWRNLLTILARMSRPPVEALMLNIRAWEALSSSTKQQRSSQGSPMTEGVPVTRLSLAMFCQGKTASQKSVKGPRMRAV